MNAIYGSYLKIIVIQKYAVINIKYDDNGNKTKNNNYFQSSQPLIGRMFL